MSQLSRVLQDDNRRRVARFIDEILHDKQTFIGTDGLLFGPLRLVAGVPSENYSLVQYLVKSFIF